MEKVTNKTKENGMSKVAFIISNSGNVNLIVDGESHTIAVDHANYNEIIARLKAEDYTDIEKLLDVASAIVKVSQGKVSVLDGCVMFDGKEVINPLTERILTFVREDLPFKPMISFLENLMENPSRTSIQELYLFLENNTLPITEDGHFLAYKKVDNDYKDFYTHSIDNSVGEVVEVERNEVDDIRDHLCSNGLHFCSQSYLPVYHGGNGRVVIVKINPKDVVSIPSDYNNAKGRTCRYEVVSEYTDPSKKYENAFGSVLMSADGSDRDADESICPDCENHVDECTCECVDCGNHVDECTCNECPDCGYHVDECVCEEPEQTEMKSVLGTKPNGKAFHNVRGSNGRFARKK